MTDTKNPWLIEAAEPLAMTSLRIPVRMKDKLDLLSNHLGRTRTEVMLQLLDRGLEEALRALKIKTPADLQGSVVPKAGPTGKVPRRRKKS